MKKKMISVLLTLCMVLALLPAAALADPSAPFTAAVTVYVDGAARDGYTVYLDVEGNTTSGWPHTLSSAGGGSYSASLSLNGPYYIYIYDAGTLLYVSPAAQLSSEAGSATVELYNLGGGAPQVAPTATWVDYELENNAVAGTDYMASGNSVAIFTSLGLAWLANHADVYFGGQYTITLNASLDMSAHVWTAGGRAGNTFNGVFDGQGHTLSGVYVNNPALRQGLFKYIVGRVKNLGVVNSYIRGDIQYVGGIAGENYGTVDNCFFSGTVRVTGDYGSNAGGIVGINILNGSIANCRNEGTVCASFNNAGGIVGHNAALVKNCYNTGAVGSAVTNMVGGIVGANTGGGTIENCYNTGSLSGRDIGGIASYNGTDSTLRYCYAQQDCGAAVLTNGSAAAGGAWFADNGGTLYDATSPTTGYSGASDLLSALQAWTGDNAGYCPWVVSGMINNGYPVFAAASVTSSGGATTNYVSFADALSAAKADNGSTLKLLSDVSVTGNTDIGGTYTVDLGSHTLSTNGGYLHTTGGMVTIIDSTGSSGRIVRTGRPPDSQNYTMSVWGTGGVTVNSGRIENVTGNDLSFTVTVGGPSGILTVNGGVVETSGIAAPAVTVGSGGTVNIAGAAQVSAPQTAIGNGGGSINISGGTVAGGIQNSGGETAWGQVHVSGGTITTVGKPVYPIVNLGNYGKVFFSGIPSIQPAAGLSTIKAMAAGRVYGSDPAGLTHYSGNPISVWCNWASQQAGDVVVQDMETGTFSPENIGAGLSYTEVPIGDGTYRQLILETLTYTVTWKSQDGETTYETDNGVAYNSGPSYGGAVPAKDGTAQYAYEFAGWATNAGQTAGTAADSLPPVSGNVTYYAAFSETPKTYAVTFNSSGGSAVPSQNVNYNAAAVQPPAPTRAGYTFAGWYADSGLTAVFNFTTAIVANTTLYAGWTELPANNGGGTTVPAPKTISVTETSSTLFAQSTGKILATANMSKAFSNSIEVKVTDGQEEASSFRFGVGNDVYPFDISLYIKGTNKKTQPADGYSVTISLPVPENLLDKKELLSIVHKSDSGVVATLDSRLSQINGFWYLVFEAAEFSPYALVVRGVGTYDVSAGIPYYPDTSGGKVFIGFSANGKYLAPSGVTVSVMQNARSFTDVSGHWAEGYIDFVTEREIFLGTGKSAFSPDTGMTRAMFATVIGRLYERSFSAIKPLGIHAFTDCDYDAYYSRYADWAAENHLIGGYGNGRFGPDDQVTREQMAAVLYRFANFLEVLPDGMDTVLNYPDSGSISGYAVNAMLYCQTTGVIGGRGGGKFAPQEAATRAEVAAIIQRIVELVLK